MTSSEQQPTGENDPRHSDELSVVDINITREPCCREETARCRSKSNFHSVMGLLRGLRKTHIFWIRVCNRPTFKYVAQKVLSIREMKLNIIMLITVNNFSYEQQIVEISHQWSSNCWMFLLLKSRPHWRQNVAGDNGDNLSPDRGRRQFVGSMWFTSTKALILSDIGPTH